MAALALLLAAGAPAAHASASQESTFQDDNLLIFAPPDQVSKTMDTLAGLGVDRLRISVFWKTVTADRDPDSPTKPSFDATDPGAYGPNAFTRYDTVVREAAAHGLQVNFDVTSPAPNWATGSPARQDIDKTYDPDTAAYGDFYTALGRRYSGTYVPAGQAKPLPRVSNWSVWNEPNQPGWLTPQWAKDPRNPKTFIEAAPQIYRGLVDHAYTALQATGHASDTFLIGETAPKGRVSAKGETIAIDAVRFLRQVYCLDDNLQYLQGTSATLRGCPVSNQQSTFAAQHPGLFKITGYAHHPYELLFAPTVKPMHPDWVTVANLADLDKFLRRIFLRYGQPNPGKAKNVPLYLTEFGYQTNPPDKTAVTPAEQAAYINQSEYIAWRNPDVKALNQFLLLDNGPPIDLNFQSGLQYINGKKKPAFGAYAMPIFLPRRKVTKGKSLTVWGGARLAPQKTRVPVAVQARSPKSKVWKTVKTARTDGRRGYLTAHIKLRKTSLVRLQWTSPAGTKRASRAVSVTVR